MGTIIKSDGTLIDNCGTTLQELKDAVGGNIQILNAKDGRLIVINDSAQNMPLNSEATNLYQYGQFMKIYGDVVICSANEIK